MQRIALFLFFVLTFVTACPSSKSTVKVGNENSAVGAAVVFLGRHWPNEFPLESKSASSILAEYGRDSSIATSLEKELEQGGVEAVRDFLFERNVFLELNVAGTKPFGLYKITQVKANQIKVQKLWSERPEPTNGFFLVDSIKGTLFVISGDGTNVLHKIPKDDEAKLPALLTEGGWAARIHRAGALLTTVYADARIIDDCSKIRTEGPASALQPIVASGIQATDGMQKAPGDQIAASFFSGVLANPEFQECPYLVMRFLGNGVDPLSFSSPFKPIAYARLSLLGKIAKECQEADGRLDLDNFGKCAWELFKDKDKSALKSLFTDLGKDSEDWTWAFDLVSKTASILPDEDVREYCKSALSIGFHIVSCLELLGVEDLPQKRLLKGDLEMSWFEGGQIKSEKISETFEVRRARELPILSASYSTELYDPCATPILWKKRWWRVCVQ